MGQGPKVAFRLLHFYTYYNFPKFYHLIKISLAFFTSQNESFKHLIRLPKPARFDIYFGIGTAILKLQAIRAHDHAHGHLRFENINGITAGLVY